MEAPRYVPVSALRRKVGSSDILSRDIKTKLKYVRYTMSGKNGLFQDCFDRGRMPVFKTVTRFMTEGGIRNLKQLKDMKESELVKLIDNVDREQWLEELDNKNTLRLYRTDKRVIRDEQFYDNTREHG